MNNSTRLPFNELLRQNIETVKSWKNKKPERVLQRLIDGLLRLMDKYHGGNGQAY